jgi:DNA processing protein
VVLNSSVKISPEDRIKTLALSRVRGIGPRVFARLVEVFGNVERILKSSLRDLSQVVSLSVARRISSKRCLEFIEDYLEEIRDSGISFTTVLDEDYPPLLKEISDPPIVLYYRGDFQVNDFKRCFAVVGTRNNTRYGEEAAKRLIEGLVNAGFTIVSGMAFGIDRLAHEVAIESGGRTIAVLSGRVDEASPRSNYKIYEEILKNGCAISATHLDRELKAGMFPPRNRIISGLSLGTLVVEAGKKSGALITAKLALEQDREVFAIPGDILAPKCIGTNDLIKKGEAKLVQDIGDILEEFGFKLENKEGKKETVPSPQEQKILDVLFRGPLCLDEISRMTNIEISEASEIVAMMELEKKLAKVEGNRYVILK